MKCLFFFFPVALLAQPVYQPVTMPQAVRAGATTSVRVAVRVAATRVDTVQLHAVEAGRLVPLALLLDDGHGPDRRRGDSIYTASVPLGLAQPGLQTLRVTASINGRAYTSPDTTIESFAAGVPIEPARFETTAVLEETAACDELTVFAVPGTNPEIIARAVGSIDGRLVGLSAFGGRNAWSVRVPCATKLDTLREAIRTVEAAGFPAEFSHGGELLGVPITDPITVRYTLETPRANVAWASTRGAGTLVAVVDTGADFSHEDLQGRLVAGANFASGSPTEFKDEQGHGTMMAGLIAANAFNDMGIAGIAPESQVLVVRVMGKGLWTLGNAAAGVRFAAASDATVINCSFGTVFSSNVLAYAIDYANRAGRLVVAGAGNHNSNVRYPAAFADTTNLWFGPTLITQTLSVGGYDERGENWRDSLYWGTAYGPELDLDAPASGVRTTHPPDVELQGEFRKYMTGSGTSASSAYVSGAAALVLSVRPDLSREQLFSLLVNTALPTGGTHPDGRLIRSVDAFRAVFQAATENSCADCPGVPEVTVQNETVRLAVPRARTAIQAPGISGAYLPLLPAASYRIRFHHNFQTFDTYANLNFFDSFSLSLNPLPYHQRSLTDPLNAATLNAAILWGGSISNLLVTPQSNVAIGTERTLVSTSPGNGQILSIVLDTFSLPGRSNTLPSWGTVTIDDITPIN